MTCLGKIRHHLYYSKIDRLGAGRYQRTTRQGHPGDRMNDRSEFFIWTMTMVIVFFILVIVGD